MGLMAWDPAFNWNSRSSFNGEARKYSILTSIVDEVNELADALSFQAIDEVTRGDTLAHVPAVNYQLDRTLALYYDQLSDDGTRWTTEKLDAEIGFSRPDSNYGNVFGPTWIDWNYQAMQLLTNTVNRSDYWDGTLGSSDSWVSPGIFYPITIRWTFYGPSLITPTVNTLSETFSWKAGVSPATPVWLRQEYIANIEDSYIEFEATYDQFLYEAPSACVFGLNRSSNFPSERDPYFEVQRDSSVIVLGVTYFGDYSSGTWKVEHVASTERLNVYFNGGLITSVAYSTGIQTPLIYAYNGRVTVGGITVKYNNGDEIALES